MIGVNPCNTALDAGNAYWMARLSSAVYLKQEDGAPHEVEVLHNLQTEDPRFLRVTGASKNSAQGMLVEHEHYFALVFRGTDELADWFDNLSILQQEDQFSENSDPVGRFHSGFLNSLDDVWEPLWAEYRSRHADLQNFAHEPLTANQHPFHARASHAQPTHDRPLFITGHSLGGAIATIAAAKLLQMNWPFTSVYTFGQPRAVAQETSDKLNALAKDRFFRFQNNSDIVTRIPARAAGFSHIGQCIYITEDQELHCDPGFWFRFLDSIEGAIESAKQFQLDFIVDHDMDGYLEGIKGWNLKD